LKTLKINLTTAAFVVGIGLAAITSLSSFTKSTGKSGDTPTYYTLDNTSGNYLNAGTTQPDYTDNCTSGGSYKCVIEEPKDEGSFFSESSIPETPVWTSPSNGFYSE